MRWVIGDIHGMLRPLEALLTSVQQQDSAARFIFVGDYVNRGPSSPLVIDRLLKLSTATFLRGNHDDIFDLIVNGTCYICRHNTPDALSALRWFLGYGLSETLSAYGVKPAEVTRLLHSDDPALLPQVMSPVPPAHRRFFRSLRSISEYEHFFVAHAMWDPTQSDVSPDISARVASDARLRHELLWGRFTLEQIHQKKPWKRTGYFGHTPVFNYVNDGELKPIIAPNIVLLDTAAALRPEGRLTAVCADNGAIVQVDRQGKRCDGGAVEFEFDAATASLSPHQFPPSIPSPGHCAIPAL